MVRYTTFEHISYISTSKKLEFNALSGSTNLWRLLGEYEPLIGHSWLYKGPLNGSECPKIGQNG